MLNNRVIPCLLLKNNGLVKTIKFKDSKYVGDPINAVKIFNDKEVDELIFLDITATKENKPIQYNHIKDIASECFMPLCYGGGIKTIDQISNLLKIGIEKVSINTEALINPELIKKSAEVFGSSTIVVSIDVKKNLFGKYSVYIKGGTENSNLDPVEYAKKIEQLGAGEILINSIDKDGTMLGYDIDIIKRIVSSVNIPVIACGGAGQLGHFKDVIKKTGVSAVAAGSFFVFHGKYKAVLISYPKISELLNLFENE